MGTITNTYWNNNGSLEAYVKQLQELVPVEGEVKTPNSKALEKFRRASNCYHDLYNNGLCNRASEFRSVFGFSAAKHKQPWLGYGEFSDALYELTEEAMDRIVLEAAMEQGLISTTQIIHALQVHQGVVAAQSLDHGAACPN